jgi:hypothetical protein
MWLVCCTEVLLCDLPVVLHRLVFFGLPLLLKVVLCGLPVVLQAVVLCSLHVVLLAVVLCGLPVVLQAVVLNMPVVHEYTGLYSYVFTGYRLICISFCILFIVCISLYPIIVSRLYVCVYYILPYASCSVSLCVCHMYCVARRHTFTILFSYVCHK